MSRWLVGLLVAIGLLSGCIRGVDDSGGVAGCEGKSSMPTVAVSLPPQAWLAGQLLGDTTRVICLLRASDDPEHFEPTLATLTALQQATLFFKVGHFAFEEELLGRLHDACPQLIVVDSSMGVEVLRGSHGHGEAGADPHTWFSVRNAQVMARNMATALCRACPSDSAATVARLSSLLARLDSLDADFTRRLAVHRGEAFIVYHPAMTYFAHDYGLRQVALQQEERDPTVWHLRQAMSAARTSGANVFFCPPQAAGGLAATLNADIGARMVPVAPPAYRLDNEMKKIVDALNGQ